MTKAAKIKESIEGMHYLKLPPANNIKYILPIPYMMGMFLVRATHV
jgi:hypothetical protein